MRLMTWPRGLCALAVNSLQFTAVAFGCLFTAALPQAVMADLVFIDDFEDGVITDTWNAPLEYLEIVGGRLRATENGRVISSLQTFSGDLRLEFDLEKVGASNHIAWDIAAGFISASDQKALGILRFDFSGVDAVATGSNDQVIYSGEPATLVNGSAANKGHATITYQNSVVDFIFENMDGQTLRAPSSTLEIAEPFNLWINIAAHPDSPRYIDNVKLYSLVPEPSSVALAAGGLALFVWRPRRVMPKASRRDAQGRSP